MATLTNTKIKDTYDGLLKTADNDVVGASEKNITDGLGNATVLSIGTASASFSNSVSITGSLTASVAVTAGTISVGDAIVHTGDIDTKIEFLSNQIKTTVGGTLAINTIATGTEFYQDAVINGLTIGKGNGSITQNTAIGVQVLDNTTGIGNTGVGYASLLANTTGTLNVAVGLNSLRYNTTGSQNSALGTYALRDNTTGTKNTALGESALANNLTSDSNTAVGYRALYTSQGAYNTAIGSNALDNNTTGGFNSAMGYNSLTTNTTGSYNISIGVNSLLSNTDGDRNVAIGYAAGDSKTSGDGNIYIGHGADGASATTSNEIVIGQNAVGKGSDTTFIGGDDVYLGDGNLGKVSIERLSNTLLELTETSNSETFSLQSNYIGDKAIYRTDTLDHAFYVGATEVMRIYSSGNVNIAGDLTVGGTMPSSDLDLTGTPYGEGDILTVSSSGTLTKIDKDSAAEYLGVNSKTLMKDLSFGESYVNNFRSRVIDNTGTYFPTPSGYNFGVMKNKGLVDKMGVMLLPSGVKSGGLFSVKPSNGNGDFDFTRASTATYVDEDGLIAVAPTGTPRLDYPLIDGVVQDTPSLLLEPSRTNLATYSENIPTNFISTDITDTFEYGISPDGLTKSTRLQLSNLGTSRYVYTLTGIVSSGTTYNFSCYYKGTAGETAYIYALPVGGTDVAKEITFTGEWQREDITFTAGASSNYVYIVDSREGGTATDFQVWGCQIEAGSYATSYIPTSGSTVTRAAETCNGAGTSADFNDSEGVLFLEAKALSEEGDRRIAISDGTTNNRVFFYYSPSGGDLNGFVVAGGTTQAGMYAGDLQLENCKLAIKYKANDCAIWANGFEMATDSISTMPTGLNQLSFDSAGIVNWYGNTKQLITFKQALTDAELEDLTSWDSFSEMAEAQQYSLS